MLKKKFDKIVRQLPRDKGNSCTSGEKNYRFRRAKKSAADIKKLLGGKTVVDSSN